MKKRNYIKPACQNIHIEYDKILAGVRCGETVITGASMRSTSSFEVCYHDKNGEWVDNQYRKGYSLWSAKVIKICAGHNVIFSPQRSSDKYDGKYSTGWENSNWSNGKCHFIGDIYVDGVLIDENYSETCSKK